MTLTMPTHDHAMVSTIGCHTQAQSPSSLPCQKSTPYMVRVVLSQPVHVVRLRDGPSGPNHGPSTAKPSSHHVHVTLWVTPPTSFCPTLSADAEPVRKCDVTKSARKGLISTFLPQYFIPHHMAYPHNSHHISKHLWTSIYITVHWCHFYNMPTFWIQICTVELKGFENVCNMVQLSAMLLITFLSHYNFVIQ